MNQQAGAIEHAAAVSGLSFDNAAILQSAAITLLAAAAQGAIDLNAMARIELANSGLDKQGAG